MYCALQYAVGVSFLVLISNMLSIVFSAPPYNFNAVGLGYMGVGPMIGNILGGLLTGFSSDIFPEIGLAMYGFGMGSICDASLTLVMDAYREV